MRASSNGGHEMSLGGVNYDTCRAVEAGCLGWKMSVRSRRPAVGLATADQTPE